MKKTLAVSLVSFSLMATSFSAVAMEADDFEKQWQAMRKENDEKLKAAFKRHKEKVEEIQEGSPWFNEYRNAEDEIQTIGLQLVEERSKADGGDPQIIAQLQSQFDIMNQRNYAIKQRGNVFLQHQPPQMQELELINEGYNLPVIPQANDAPNPTPALIFLDRTDDKKMSGHQLSNMENRGSLNLTQNLFNVSGESMFQKRIFTDHGLIEPKSQNLRALPIKINLNPTSLSQVVVIQEDKTMKVTTDYNAHSSYQLESDRLSVVAGETIHVPYEIIVEEGGIMSLGLLSTSRTWWYGEELILKAGRYSGTYERIVPLGETVTSLVFRNYHLGTPGQTTFTIKEIGIVKK